MKAKLNTFALSLLVLAFVPLFPSIATAQESTCPPHITTGVVTEKVIVPPVEACIITASQVLGNIEVGAGSTLTITAAEYRGNILLGDGATLILNGGTLFGNVECQNGGSVVLNAVTVMGNISGCLVT